jgi:O-antigen/teichoic acid export membrane protein
VLASSLPFALLIFFSMISGRVDAVLLERINGSYHAGIYAMAFRLGDMLTMISYLFAVLLLPMFSRQLARHEEPRELFGISFRLLLTGCVWVLIISIFEAEAIMRLLYDMHATEAAKVLPWTIGAAVMFSLQYATGTLLTAGHKMKLMIVLAVLSLAVNITVNIQLIPYSGPIGAAQAALFTQAFVFLLQSIFIQRFYRVWTKKLLIQSAVFVGLSMITSFWIATMNLPAHFNILSISALVIVASVLAGTLPISDIKKILPIANQSSEDS